MRTIQTPAAAGSSMNNRRQSRAVNRKQRNSTVKQSGAIVCLDNTTRRSSSRTRSYQQVSKGANHSQMAATTNPQNVTRNDSKSQISSITVNVSNKLAAPSAFNRVETAMTQSSYHATAAAPKSSHSGGGVRFTSNYEDVAPRQQQRLELKLSENPREIML